MTTIDAIRIAGQRSKAGFNEEMYAEIQDFVFETAHPLNHRSEAARIAFEAMGLFIADDQRDEDVVQLFVDTFG